MRAPTTPANKQTFSVSQNRWAGDTVFDLAGGSAVLVAAVGGPGFSCADIPPEQASSTAKKQNMKPFMDCILDRIRRSRGPYRRPGPRDRSFRDICSLGGKRP